MNKRTLLVVISLIIFIVIILIIVSSSMKKKQSTNIAKSPNSMDTTKNDADEVNWDLPPMICYNGDIYQMYNTIKDTDVSTLELLGQITNTVDLTEIPKKNFETNCNYMGYNVYRYADDVLLVEYPEGSYNLFELNNSVDHTE